MNIIINRLDNLIIGNKSFEFVPENVKKEMDIYGMIVGRDGKFGVNGKDVMILIKKSNLKHQIGANMYNALLRKPMMIFLMATSEEEIKSSFEENEREYTIQSLHLNNLAQAFSLACWFIKDSCVLANFFYWINLFTGYNSQSTRDMPITMSNGTISEIRLTSSEMQEAIDRMYEVYIYLMPDQSKMGQIHLGSSAGTRIVNVDNAISTEGNSFARALIILQEARRTGVVSSKIDKYCSLLECLYSINREHKKNISNITAAYIAKDKLEQEVIKKNMRDAYGVRSDSSHGDSLIYLKEKDKSNLIELSGAIDEYVRRVFRKIISESGLNYGNSSEERARVRRYFIELAKTAFPE